VHLIRYSDSRAEQPPQYGFVAGDKVGPILGDVFGTFARGEATLPLADLTVLPPCTPSKIIAVAYNFPERLRELDLAASQVPLLHFKAPSAIAGPGEPIRLPPQASDVHYGGALAVVIGKRTRWAGLADAAGAVLGYTCANDLIALDVAEVDQTWTRAGSFDTFCPLGPAIATHVDPAELMITTQVNGVTRQLASTIDLLFSVPQVVAFVSAALTLLPGDVILMGTPGGSGPLAAGDTVSVSIEHIGELSSPVTAERRA
jgi:2-keto-4-pentenoate hydratase/2-oxohepta-3-ene-1,7-dioic acid hydratase in catechol pathway